MNDKKPIRGRVGMAAGASALLIAGAIGGAMLVNAVGASAATLTAATASPSASASTSTSEMPEHGSSSHESQETAVTGAAATSAKAAAVKAAGSGTAGAVTTDFTGKGYEVTVTKSDGSTVEIHLDSSFAVMSGGPHEGAAG